jgi:DNA-binding protein YbaB
MSENNDENIKKAKQAADMVMLQQKARDYQDKLNSLMNKEYQGKYQGISIKMKGDFTLLEVNIDQSFYETASKGQIENGIRVLFTNLHNAIAADQDNLKQELQLDLSVLQKDQQL